MFDLAWVCRCALVIDMFMLCYGTMTPFLLFLHGHVDKHVNFDGMFNTFERLR